MCVWAYESQAIGELRPVLRLCFGCLSCFRRLSVLLKHHPNRSMIFHDINSHEIRSSMNYTVP